MGQSFKGMVDFDTARQGLEIWSVKSFGFHSYRYGIQCFAVAQKVTIINDLCFFLWVHLLKDFTVWIYCGYQQSMDSIQIILYGGFLKWGYNQSSSIYRWIFHEINQPYWKFFRLWKPPFTHLQPRASMPNISGGFWTTQVDLVEERPWRVFIWKSPVNLEIFIGEPSTNEAFSIAIFAEK